MGAAASRLAKQRPLGFAALVTVIRDRVLSGTDLPTSARINLIEAFAIGKATEVTFSSRTSRTTEFCCPVLALLLFTLTFVSLAFPV